MLEGEIEVKLKDGKSKKFHAGEGLAEVVNTLHNGRNTGKVPAKLIVFYAGAEGKKITEKEIE
jgi:quercetin dioxygenase-like cupin family protein